MKYLRLALVTALLGLVFIGGVVVRGQRQRRQTEQGVSPILIEARSQMRAWMNITFKRCPSSQSKSEERYTLLNGRLINFSDLVFNLDSEPLSRLEEKDGLEFKGSIRLIKADYREYDAKVSRWGRFSEGTFASKGGSLPDLIRVEKMRSSNWDSSFGSPYKSLSSVSCDHLISGLGLEQYLMSPSDKREMAALAEEEARLLREVAREKELLKKTVDTVAKEKAVKSADESVFQKEVQSKIDKFLLESVLKCGETRYIISRLQLSSQVCACEIQGVDSLNGTITELDVAGGKAVLTLSGTKIVEHCYTGSEYTLYQGSSTGPLHIYFKKQSPEWEIHSSSGAGVGVVQPTASSSSCQKVIDAIDSWRSFGRRRR